LGKGIDDIVATSAGFEFTQYSASQV